MRVKEIQAKTCMTKSKLTDYVINPYTGCEHSCFYCYADFIRRFQNIKEKWGEFVFVKVNFPELLEKEIVKAKPGNIWLSSVCDCYQPIEKKYKLTRKILEIISKSPNKDKFTIEILTKSCLVERDFDLIKEIGNQVELGMSVGLIDDEIAKIIEPNASLPSERLKTLRKANDFGIRTYGFISPVLPGMADLDEIFKRLKEAKVNYVWVELFNIRKSILDKVIPFIKKNLPDKLEDFENMIKNYDAYVESRRKEIAELEKKYDLKVKEVVVHEKDRVK
jgi:DNA repair photolyase